MGIFSKLLSVGEDKPLKKYQKVVETINDLEPRMQAYSDDELAHLTVEFRERLDSGEELDDLLTRSFAAVREAAYVPLGFVISTYSLLVVWLCMMARLLK